MAKIASDMNKPDGLTVILPEEVEDFIEKLPIEKFYGVGTATIKKMHSLGIYKGLDLKQHDLIFLNRNFGKFGAYLYDVVRGLDKREVKPHRIRKSISVERTYAEDLETDQQIKEKIQQLTILLSESLEKKDIKGKTANLKLRYSDFTTLTRSKTLPGYFNDKATLTTIISELIVPLIREDLGIRLLGVGISNLDIQKNYTQLKLDF
jgi:DNA polymerase-4